jgi:hypothetical protein
VYIASIRLQIEDWVADELPRTVIGDVATPSRLVHFDLPRREQFGRRDQVRSRRIGIDAKRDDVGMFEQEKEIRHVPRSTRFDERALHLAGDAVGNNAKPPDL